MRLTVLYKMAMDHLYYDPTDHAAHDGEIEFQPISSMAIPTNADPHAPSKTVVARACPKFH